MVSGITRPSAGGGDSHNAGPPHLGAAPGVSAGEMRGLIRGSACGVRVLMHAKMVASVTLASRILSKAPEQLVRSGAEAEGDDFEVTQADFSPATFEVGQVTSIQSQVHGHVSLRPSPLQREAAEALAISFMGGVLGVILAYAIALSVGRLTLYSAMAKHAEAGDIRLIIEPGTLLIATLILTAVGL